MRFSSAPQDGFRIFAVTGVNTVSFAIQADDEGKKGLLGFAVERADPEENERYFMPGFKVFASVVPHPGPDTEVSTWDHPVQSFVWDDFTAKPKREYEYFFYPVRGTPRNLDRSAAPARIVVRTEPRDGELHDVYFNRGIVSSQAYRRKFGNRGLDEMDAAEQERALQWLTRDLDEAILRFIRGAGEGDTLLGCFYEFRYRPVADALKEAVDRGVEVRLIVDGKENGSTNRKTGKVTPPFPRDDNLRMLKDSGVQGGGATVLLRQAKPGDIQHNKFLVLLRGGTKPAEVWTGSVNLSRGGFAGQTNVGHWVRDEDVAALYAAYWELLSTDPGAAPGADRKSSDAANRELKAKVQALHDVPTRVDQIPAGTTVVFSPRSGLKVLDMYMEMADSANTCACVTLAFGINRGFKERLIDNTPQSHLVFLLLDKKDAPRSGSTTPFVPITRGNNVYQAWGARIDDPVLAWARETDARAKGLNTHVAYIHSKFLLMNPLGGDPIVVTGSANFSDASTTGNDENMLVIRGDTRVADIYFTEFNRLFNHFYFRSIREELAEGGDSASGASLFLAEKPGEWLRKYRPGTLRSKRVALYAEMVGARTL